MDKGEEMNNIVPFEKVLTETRPKFLKARTDKEMKWAQEAHFARQAFESNQQLAECTPQSVAAAILNVAAIGLSLNPALRHAYLIPRRRKVGENQGVRECQLSVSYLGMKHVAEQSGSVSSVRADVIFEADEWDYESGDEPKLIHKPNITARDRGERKAVYVVATLNDGSKHITVVPGVDVEAVRECSENPGGKFSPWTRFTDEMWKKTAVRKAAKYWPTSERLDTALHVSNQADGLSQEYLTSTEPTLTRKQAAELRAIFHKTGGPKGWVAAQMKLLARVFQVKTASRILQRDFDAAKERAELGVAEWFKAHPREDK